MFRGSKWLDIHKTQASSVFLIKQKLSAHKRSNKISNRKCAHERWKMDLIFMSFFVALLLHVQFFYESITSKSQQSIERHASFHDFMIRKHGVVSLNAACSFNGAFHSLTKCYWWSLGVVSNDPKKNNKNELLLIHLCSHESYIHPYEYIHMLTYEDEHADQ